VPLALDACKAYYAKTETVWKDKNEEQLQVSEEYEDQEHLRRQYCKVDWSKGRSLAAIS